MALTYHNNNSISNITSFAQVPSGSPVLLSTATASGSSSISFTSGIDSTYDVYQFEFIDFNPSVDNAGLYFQTSTNGGSTYATTITSTFFYAFHFEADTPTALTYDASFDQAQGTSFQRLIDGTGNLSDESGAGTLQLFAPSSTTYVKHYMSNCNSYVDGTFTTNYYGAGYFNTTSAINAIKFQPTSGNFDGTIKMYGIK